jgi:hypothetical protein
MFIPFLSSSSFQVWQYLAILFQANLNWQYLAILSGNIYTIPNLELQLHENRSRSPLCNRSLHLFAHLVAFGRFPEVVVTWSPPQHGHSNKEQNDEK